MKKTLIIVLSVLLTFILSSCSFINQFKGEENNNTGGLSDGKNEGNQAAHDHVFGQWQYDDSFHWCDAYCTLEQCDIDTVNEHFDYDENNICDICGYEIPTVSSDVALIVIEYENTLRAEIEKLEKDNPGFEYYYNPVDEIHCTFVLDRDASADEIVAKYDMNNVFAAADVSALNAIKMISVIFDRDDFTEEMHQKIKQISDEEPAVNNLFVDMERKVYQSYMPKIEYYADDAVKLKYEKANSLIGLSFDEELIIKSKADYDNYINRLLEKAKYDEQIELINSQKDLYDEAFFEENALIITRIISRGSSSIKLTVNNLYISGGSVYVVVSTEIPGIGDDAMQYQSFTFIVSKDEVLNAEEVITLE